jgi:hypothetical protein
VLRREGGYIVPPEVPGLGVKLTSTNVDGVLGPLGNKPLHEIPIRSDGSVVYAV